jgi:hypothetical protein
MTYEEELKEHYIKIAVIMSHRLKIEESIKMIRREMKDIKNEKKISEMEYLKSKYTCNIMYK